MKNLAKKGRFGDTEIRKVDGKPAHVNKQEAKLIDRKGKLGEILVKSIGAGTTNPETGLREYHRSKPAHRHDRSNDNMPGNPGAQAAAAQSGNTQVVAGDGGMDEGEWLGTMTAIGVFLVTGDIKGALSAGYSIYEIMAEADKLKASGDIADDQYEQAVKYWDAYSGWLNEKYESEKTAWEETYGDGGYYDQVFGSETETYNALKEAYTSQMGYTPTEKEMRAKYKQLMEEGDPELQKMLDEQAKLVMGGIRQQGSEGVQRAQGRVIGQGLEGSIVASELVRQVDRDTLKSLSETARSIALENTKAQYDIKKGAQSDLWNLDLSLDARKRSTITNLAGLTEPIKKPDAPYPTKGIPGQYPTNTSGLYQQPGYAPYLEMATQIPWDEILGSGDDDDYTWGD